MNKHDNYIYILGFILVIILIWIPVIYLKTNEYTPKETKIIQKTERKLEKELEKMSVDLASNLNNNLKINLLSKQFLGCESYTVGGHTTYSRTGVAISETPGNEITTDIYLGNFNIKNNSKYNLHIIRKVFDSVESSLTPKDINMDKNSSENVNIECSSDMVFCEVNISEKVNVKVKNKVLTLPVTINLNLCLYNTDVKIDSIDFTVESTDIENALSKSFNLNFEDTCTKVGYSYNLNSNEK